MGFFGCVVVSKPVYPLWFDPYRCFDLSQYDDFAKVEFVEEVEEVEEEEEVVEEEVEEVKKTPPEQLDDVFNALDDSPEHEISKDSIKGLLEAYVESLDAGEGEPENELQPKARDALKKFIKASTEVLDKEMFLDAINDFAEGIEGPTALVSLADFLTVRGKLVCLPSGVGWACLGVVSFFKLMFSGRFCVRLP